MSKIELFNFIEDNAVFKGIGTFFVLVDEGFRIHNINYDAVNPGTHMHRRFSEMFQCSVCTGWMRLSHELQAV